MSSHDEATFLQMQQRPSGIDLGSVGARRLQAVPVPYAEPVLPEARPRSRHSRHVQGTDELLLAARPGQCPLLLVGARTSTGASRRFLSGAWP